jgi:glucose/mannose-6-phosphate isomerase
VSTQASISLEPPYAADPRGMAALIDGIPEQTERALQHSTAYPWKLSNRIPSVLAVGAMGGSAIAADLTAGLYADHIPRPIFVVRDYHWPAFLTREAFALLGSYSGATEETLSLYQDAARRGVPRAAITTGGALASMCDRDDVPWCKLPHSMPPRAAMYSSWVPLTMLLAALEWCDDPSGDWRGAIEALRGLREKIGTAVPEERNPAKQLARTLLGRRLYLYSATERMWAVGTRLRQQLNENAKLLVHLATAPELNHNEIVGWEDGEAAGQMAVMFLHDREDSREAMRRLALTRDYVAGQGAMTLDLEPGAGRRLARLATHVMFGDYLSLYLALARGVDPTPVASIDEFKRRMAERPHGW